MNRKSFLQSFLAAVALVSVPKAVSSAALKVADVAKSLPIVNVLDGKWHPIALVSGERNEINVDGTTTTDRPQRGQP